jgi:hypothetical protein
VIVNVIIGVVVLGRTDLTLWMMGYSQIQVTRQLSASLLAEYVHAWICIAERRPATDHMMTCYLASGRPGAYDSMSKLAKD